MQAIAIKVFVGDAAMYNKFRHKIHKVVMDFIPSHDSIYIHGHTSCNFYAKGISLEKLVCEGIIVKYDCWMCEANCPLTDYPCGDPSHRNVKMSMDITLRKPYIGRSSSSNSSNFVSSFSM